MEGRDLVHLEAGEHLELPLRLSLPYGSQLPTPAVTVEFHVEADDAASIRATAESRFLGPR